MGVAAVTGNTGLLTARCDPYGAESRIQLMGGLYPENMVGRIMWHCDEPAAARYRMRCVGGQYGERSSAGAGIVPAYMCPGGHKGQVMALCISHRKEIAKRQAGLCPRCANPEHLRPQIEALEGLQRAMSQAQTIGHWPAMARLTAQMEPLQEALTGYYHRGLIHRCPLQLVEVS